MFWLKKYKQAVYRSHKWFILSKFPLILLLCPLRQANVATIMDKRLGTLLHFWGRGVFHFTHAQPYPSPHPTNNIGPVYTEFFRVSTLYRVRGGRTARKFRKGCTAFWVKLKKIMNTALFQGPLSMIVVNPQPYFQSFHVNLPTITDKSSWEGCAT